MGEQAGFLEHISQGAFMNRQAVVVVLPHIAVDGQLAGAGLQAGNAAQQGGFAAAGMAEQCGNAVAWQLQVHIQLETLETGCEADKDPGLFHDFRFPLFRRPLIR